MVGQADKTLFEYAARYSYFPDPDANEPLDVSREKYTDARRSLVGRHDDEITIVDTDFGRRFTPRKIKQGPRKLIVYIHGGGWRNCNVITHASAMSDLAVLCEREVFGLSYPLAPEHVHPAAIDTVCAKIEKIATEEGCEIALAGDSAGANLALAAALRLRDEKKPVRLYGLLLYYGCYRRLYDTRSHKAYGDGSNGLATEWMRALWNFYLPDDADPKYADLSDADMSGLPPVFICEAECDCLADDSRWLAARLMDAGVRHFHDAYEGAVHGFIHYSKFHETSYRALRSAGRFLSMIED
nr:alpha/beta hydrolase [uncultured Cohaesibacter sp.]